MKKVEYVKYVAFDGVEFDDEKECAEYERAATRKTCEKYGIEDITVDDMYGDSETGWSMMSDTLGILAFELTKDTVDEIKTLLLKLKNDIDAGL